MMSFLASKLMKEEKIVKSNYQELAQAIIVGVGGEDNIEKVFHCITRLRFTFKGHRESKSRGTGKAFST